MLKSYFVEHILLTFLMYVVFFKWIYVVKSNYFKITPLPTSVCFISQINIMHEYIEIESKYIGKIGTHNMWETNVHNTVKLKIMLSEARVKKNLI